MPNTYKTPTKKNCVDCDTEFLVTSNRQKRCSRQCTLKALGLYTGPRQLVCVVCQKGFATRVPGKQICSAECARVRFLATKKRRYDKWRKENPEGVWSPSLKPRAYTKKMSTLPRRLIVCTMCPATFIVVGSGHKKTCSEKCSVANSRAPKKTGQPRTDHQRAISRAFGLRYGKKPEVQVYRFLRNNLNKRIKAKGQRTSLAIPYTPAQLRQHLESLFLPGMTWENHSPKGWHIDHKKPLCKFKFFDENGAVLVGEIRKAMSLENLQPLWATDNIRKNGKYVEPVIVDEQLTLQEA